MSHTDSTSTSPSSTPAAISMLIRLYETFDISHALFSYLDVTALASLYVCLGRRQPLPFVQRITNIHTGYFNLWPYHADLSQDIEEFFSVYLKVARTYPEEVPKLESIVLFAREFPSKFPHAPLNFCNAMQLLSTICACMNIMSFNCMNSLTVDIIDENPHYLVKKVNLSKTFMTTLQHQITMGTFTSLTSLSLCSPYSNTEAAPTLEMIRCFCPNLERMDIHLNFTVEDFQAFIDPGKVWPSLKELEVGNLIERFLTKLELDDYFQNQFTDAEDTVMYAITAALTREKFPNLAHLEVCSPHAEFTYTFFKSMVQQWSDGLRYDHIVRQGTFVGNQIQDFLFYEADSGHRDHSSWASQWSKVFKQNRMYTSFSDPTLQRYCLFPNVDKVIFHSDLPNPAIMLLFNCGIGMNAAPKGLGLQVSSRHWTHLCAFLENVCHPSRWRIEDLRALPNLEFHTTKIRRKIFDSRGYTAVRFVDINGSNTAPASSAAIVGESLRQQLQQYGEFHGMEDDDYLEDELETSANRFIEALNWRKLECLQNLSISDNFLSQFLPLVNSNSFWELVPDLKLLTIHLTNGMFQVADLMMLVNGCRRSPLTELHFTTYSYNLFQSTCLFLRNGEFQISNESHYYSLLICVSYGEEVYRYEL